MYECVAVQVHQGLRELDSRVQQVKRNTAAGGWGRSDSWAPAVALEELSRLRDSLRSTEKMHNRLLQAFLKGLPDAANEVSGDCGGSAFIAAIAWCPWQCHC